MINERNMSHVQATVHCHGCAAVTLTDISTCTSRQATVKDYQTTHFTIHCYWSRKPKCERQVGKRVLCGQDSGWHVVPHTSKL